MIIDRVKLRYLVIIIQHDKILCVVFQFVFLFAEFHVSLMC